MHHPERDLRSSLGRTMKRYYVASGALIFVLGIILRLVASFYVGVQWQILGEVGTFLAAAIAVPFIYFMLVKGEERQLYLSDLENLLDEKLGERSTNNRRIKFYEAGRLSVEKKVVFFKDAEHEVIELGIAMRTLAGYFQQRPYTEFRKPVEDLLQHGVNFKLILLNPDTEIARKYAEDIGEPELVGNIKLSISTLFKVRDELGKKSLSGKFEMYLYEHFPSCYVMLVDPLQEEGRMLVSHYIHGINRADTPVVEVYKSSNPLMFKRYHQFLNDLLAKSKKI